MGLCLAGALATGCGEKAEPKTIVVGSSTPAALASAALQDPLGPRYAATLSEGIDFTKPGYPEFVADVTGISSYEPWARWSDANLAPTVGIRLRQALPTRFSLELKINAFGPNLGEPVIVRIGGVERRFVHADPRTIGTYRLEFDAVPPVDRIEIVAPKPASPSELRVGDDTRRVGIAFVSLRILN